VKCELTHLPPMLPCWLYCNCNRIELSKLRTMTKTEPVVLFSRVSHKGEFYLERFLMRKHCTTAPFEV